MVDLEFAVIAAVSWLPEVREVKENAGPAQMLRTHAKLDLGPDPRADERLCALLRSFWGVAAKATELSSSFRCRCLSRPKKAAATGPDDKRRDRHEFSIFCLVPAELPEMARAVFEDAAADSISWVGRLANAEQADKRKRAHPFPDGTVEIDFAGVANSRP
jgi:hypothetical protein